MPGTFLDGDMGLPELSGSGSTEEKIRAISGYLFMLLEQLRYILGNLALENFSDSGISDLSQVITEPVKIQLQDLSGNVTELTITAEGIQSTVTDLDKNFSTLKQTVDGLHIQTVGGQSTLSGIALLFYDEDGKTVIGQVNMDENGDTSTGDNKYRMFVKAGASKEGETYSLKLESTGNSSFESGRMIYMLGKSGVQVTGSGGSRFQTNNGGRDGNMTLFPSAGTVVSICDGRGWYDFKPGGLYHNNIKIGHSEAEIRSWIQEALGAANTASMSASVPDSMPDPSQEKGESV